MEHVLSFEMVRSCCHVYVPKAMVGTLTLILVYFLGIEYNDHKLDTSCCCYVAFGVVMDLLVTSAHGYLETVVMLISLGLEKYLLGQLMVSAGSPRGSHLIWT